MIFPLTIPSFTSCSFRFSHPEKKTQDLISETVAYCYRALVRDSSCPLLRINLNPLMCNPSALDFATRKIDETAPMAVAIIINLLHRLQKYPKLLILGVAYTFNVTQLGCPNCRL